MLVLNIVYVLFLNLFLYVICFEPLIKNDNNYGPYILTFDHYADCKGPKLKNVTVMQSELDYKSLTAVINYTFLFDAKIDEIKIQMHNVKGDKKTTMWNHKFKDPCKHFTLAALIEHNLHASNCFIKKGFYRAVINYGDLASSFLGSSFFYGTYLHKVGIFSNKGNIACYNYTGPYILTFDHYADCKGPKLKNVTITQSELDHKALTAVINYTFLFDAKIDEIKIQMHNVKGDKKTTMWNHKFKDPCKHFTLAAMIEHSLHANNCLIKKGYYRVVLNYRDLASSFLGSSFFYGTYLHKVGIFSNKGNIACYNYTITFSKKE